MSHELDRFEGAFREWALRPPDRTGAEAAQVVLATIRVRRRRRFARWSGLAAAAVLVAGVVSTHIMRAPEGAPTVVAAAGDIRTEGLSDGVVLMWLDDETPLYMTFQGRELPGPERGATP